MRNPEELLESGLAAIRASRPTTNLEHLLNQAKRAQKVARLRQLGLGAGLAVLTLGPIALFLGPTSALASFHESLRLSDSQVIVRFHSVEQTGAFTPPTRQDTWIMPDRFIRSGGHSLFFAQKNGTAFSYDDRFPYGLVSPNPDWLTKFFKSPVTGTIADMVGRLGPQYVPTKIEDVEAHGGRYTLYRFKVPGAADSSTDDFFVDPNSKLMRFEDQHAVYANGTQHDSSLPIDYPTPESAKRDLPRFPNGLKFLTEADLTKQFRSRIRLPEQSKTVGGIRVTLYGVLIGLDPWHREVQASVITKGGAGADLKSGPYVKVLGGDLLPAKAADGLGPTARLMPPGLWQTFRAPDLDVAGKLTIGRESYNIQLSDDLLKRVPKTLTVRVPVWRSDKSKSYREEGKTTTFHPSILLGYATFTTSKIFTTAGDDSWSLLDNRPAGLIAAGGPG